MAGFDTLLDLAPASVKVVLGVRKLREIEIFPLSLADQIALSNKVAEELVNFRQWMDEGETATNVQFVSAVSECIRKNLDEVMGMITDSKPVGSCFIEEITNVQLVNIVTAIWDMNFEDAAKNFKDLSKKIRNRMGETTPEKKSISERSSLQ